MSLRDTDVAVAVQLACYNAGGRPGTTRARFPGMSTSTTRTKSNTLDNPRIRFAWGYQDAAAELARGKRRSMAGHFDRAYALGYEAAARQGADVDRSGSAVEAAWKARRKRGQAPWMANGGTL
jgi:hypothetical protein